MSMESYRESPGKFDSRTLSRKTLSRWTGRILLMKTAYIVYESWSTECLRAFPESSVTHGELAAGHNILDSIYHILYTIHYTLYTIHYTLYTIHYTLYTIL